MFILDLDIEENDETCVVRIAPKPIKIKIKPLLPPPELQSSPSFPHMHPKKKMVHMDSLSNSLNNGQAEQQTGSQSQAEKQLQSRFGNQSHSDLDSESQSHSKVDPVNQSGLDRKSSNLSDNSNQSVSRTLFPNHSGHSSYGGGVQPETISTPLGSQSGVSSELQNGAGGRERRTRTPGTAKKGRDSRTQCDVCQGEGTNANLVRLVS